MVSNLKSNFREFCIVSYTDANKFSMEMAEVIDRYQDKGNVEIKFSTTTKGDKIIFSALIMGRD